MKKNYKNGFTIVELVIVIAVIAILSAILIPTFSNLVKQANETALQENLRNAYVEYTSETADSDEYLGQDEIIFKNNNKYYKYYTGDDETTNNVVEQAGKYYEINVEANEIELVADTEENSTFNKNYVAYKYVV